MRIFRQNVAVTGREYDRKTRITFAQQGRELDTIHARHDDIGKNQIDGKFVLGKKRQRIFRI